MSTKPTGPTCIRCHQPVVEIAGAQLTRGRLPTHKHDPRWYKEACGLGDPLFSEQVIGVEPSKAT